MRKALMALIAVFALTAAGCANTRSSTSSAQKELDHKPVETTEDALAQQAEQANAISTLEAKLETAHPKAFIDSKSYMVRLYKDPAGSLVAADIPRSKSVFIVETAIEWAHINYIDNISQQVASGWINGEFLRDHNGEYLDWYLAALKRNNFLNTMETVYLDKKFTDFKAVEEPGQTKVAFIFSNKDEVYFKYSVGDWAAINVYSSLDKLMHSGWVEGKYLRNAEGKLLTYYAERLKEEQSRKQAELRRKQNEKRRKAAREEALRKLSPDTQVLVRAGKITHGMSREAVILSLGEPAHKNKTVYANHQHEQWVYGSSTYVYFDNGVVTSWQVTE